MQDNVKFISMNCRGLANSQKRQDVLSYLKSKKYDVCCIQDTHFIPSTEAEIRKEWKGECFLSCNTSNSRGVAILFKDTIPVKVNRVMIGNFVILDLKLYEYNLTFISLYGPNTDKPDFFC